MGGDGAVDDSNESSGGDGVNINIRCSSGSKFSVQISLDSSVGSFKSILAEKSDTPTDQQRLIYKGRILKDDQTLRSYGLEADHTVHLVRGFSPAAASNPAGGTNPGVPNTTQSNTRSVGSNEGEALGGAGFGASLFPGLGINGMGGGGNGGGAGGNGLFGAGLPDFEQVQQQLTRNPNIMREIMNMPVVQNLMNNPDVMRNLIMNNPQMREIIDRNPELAHILNDPSTLRQTLEAARNPELMREMMRNTDRAMSNIESSPEGFNMLRRMYENVQEPFLNATTMAGNAGNDNANPFAALLGTQGGDQARNPSTTPSTTSSETTTGSPAPNTNPLPNPWTATAAGGQSFLSQRTIYRLEPLDDNPNLSTCSSKGWLVKVEEYEPGRVRLLNPLSSLRIRFLPDSFPKVINLLDFRVVEIGKAYKLQHSSGMNIADVDKLLLFPNSAWTSCVEYKLIFGLFHEGKLGYVKYGDKNWTFVDDNNFYCDDITVYKGQPYVVDSLGIVSWIDSSMKLIQFLPPLCGLGNQKHLVESCGELYVVDRFFDGERRLDP
ncbi:hypothetical protein CMV_016823 [Castanea mollissima]|uniref:Ubiquitin-like domain-containing protein n=1 Tax=Castanea mollissima TaxID=60419 RepID=A0A8J4R384_9ROSI|nr:hypothetical protein CMV_016823 [Castanea mollissima]